jgi:hypothetical protein
MLRYAFVVLLTLACGCVFAQPNPPVRWQHNISPLGNVALAPTSFGGHVVAGNAWNGVEHAVAVCTDSTGTELWSRSYVLSPWGDTSASITALGGDGYVLAGCIHNDGAHHESPFGFLQYSRCGLLRIDANGDSLWFHTYGPDSTFSGATCVQPMSDGGFLVGGNEFIGPEYWNYKASLRKVDENGNVLWERSSDSTSIWHIRPVQDGGFIVLGRQWVTRLDALGDTVWSRTYSNGTNNYSFIDVAALEEGFMLYSDGSNYCGSLVRTDLAGDTLWTRTYPVNTVPTWAALVPTDEDVVVIAGTLRNFPGSRFQFLSLVRFSPTGDIRWTWMDGDTSIFEWQADMLRTAEGGYAVAALGEANNMGGFYSLILRTGPDLTPDAVIKADVLPQSFSLSAYPNPFNPSTVISFSLPRTEAAKLTIYDILGKEVATLADQSYSAGAHTVSFDGSMLTSGTYFAHLQAISGSCTQKIVLLR